MKERKFLDKIMQIANAMGQNKYLSSISGGLMGTLPILMLGSFALLLAVIPIAPYTEFISSIGLQASLKTVSTLTTSLIAIYAAFTVSYRLAEKFEVSPLVAALVSVFCFFVVTPLAQAEVDGTVKTFLDNNWMGAQGLFSSLIVALTSCRLYCYLIQKKITIKMPESVESIVASSFASLIPALITGFIYMVIGWLFTFTLWGSATQFIYTLVAMPLASLSNSIWSLLVILLVQQILWFFGISGSLVVYPFILSLYLPLDMENMEMIAAGAANSELPNIVCKAFYNCFCGIGGAGGTLSLCILLLLLAKSKKNKTIGQMTTLPGVFQINEPVVFGYPMVLNPVMFIPFILTPLVQAGLAYLAIASGLFPRLMGTQISFGFPICFTGFIAGGWKIAVLQILLVLVGIIIYYPFFRLSEKMALEEEMGEQLEERLVEGE